MGCNQSVLLHILNTKYGSTLAVNYKRTSVCCHSCHRRSFCIPSNKHVKYCDRMALVKVIYAVDKTCRCQEGLDSGQRNQPVYLQPRPCQSITFFLFKANMFRRLDNPYIDAMQPVNWRNLTYRLLLIPVQIEVLSGFQLWHQRLDLQQFEHHRYLLAYTVRGTFTVWSFLQRSKHWFT